MIQIGGGDVSGPPKYDFLHFACLMYRFMHVLCADVCMCYVTCSPNGLAALRLARFARFASVQCLMRNTLLMLHAQNIINHKLALDE